MTASPKLKMIDINIGRTMCNIASPGHWEPAHNGTMSEQDATVLGLSGALICETHHGRGNAEFIAYARVALPAAIDEIERLRSVIPAVRSFVNLASTSDAAKALSEAIDAAEQRELGVYQDGTDTVIAYDHLDVFRVLLAQYGSVEHELDDFVRRDNDYVLTINDEQRNDEGRCEPVKISMTCREWIAKDGRGFLCSTEY